MRSGSPKKSWFRQIVFVLFLVVAAANGQDYHEEAMEAANKYNKRGPFGVIKEKFNDLPPAGKFAASAVVGFVGSRVALKTFVSAAKIAGATFIAAEVLSVSGVLDDMPPFMDDHVQTVTSVKDRLLVEANKFRTNVRKSLEKERTAALGFAAGAFVGMAL